MAIRITKPIWINGKPLNVGATVSLKPRLAMDLIATGAAQEIDTEQSVDSGSTPDCSTKKKTSKKKGEKDGSITRKDKGEKQGH